MKTRKRLISGLISLITIIAASISNLPFTLAKKSEDTEGIFQKNKLALESDLEVRQFLRERYQVVLYQAKQQNVKLNPKALRNALQYYYEHLDFCRPNQLSPCNSKTKKIHNHRFLFIADFGQNSSSKRGMKIDLLTGKIKTVPVAVGRGSQKKGDNPSKYNFANYKDGLHTTVPGFMTTANQVGTHHGSYRAGGRSRGYTAAQLTLIGLESRNSPTRGKNAHGAPYCNSNSCGRSHGCPALPQKDAKEVLNDLKGGALWYHYVPRLDEKVQIASSGFDPSSKSDSIQYAEADKAKSNNGTL